MLLLAVQDPSHISVFFFGKLTHRTYVIVKTLVNINIGSNTNHLCYNKSKYCLLMYVSPDALSYLKTQSSHRVKFPVFRVHFSIFSHASKGGKYRL